MLVAGSEHATALRPGPASPVLSARRWIRGEVAGLLASHRRVTYTGRRQTQGRLRGREVTGARGRLWTPRPSTRARWRASAPATSVSRRSRCPPSSGRLRRASAWSSAVRCSGARTSGGATRGAQRAGGCRQDDRLRQWAEADDDRSPGCSSTTRTPTRSSSSHTCRWRSSRSPRWTHVRASLSLAVPPVRERILPLVGEALAAAPGFVLVLDDAHVLTR